MQNRRRFLARARAWGVWAGCALLCLPSAAMYADNGASATILTCSESYRTETLTTDMGNSRESVSASGGKLSISAELPTPQKTLPEFNAATPVTVSVGSYTFHSMLGTDPDYRPGKTSAKLLQLLPNASGNTRTIVGTIQARWSRDKISLKVDAKLPQAGKPIAALDFTGHPKGSVSGEANASLQIGEITAELNVELQGHVQRRSSSSGFQYGEVVVIDLRGKAVETREKTATAPTIKSAPTGS